MSLSPFFDDLYEDVTKKGGCHLIGLKQVGKSNLKKSLTSYVIKKYPESKTIIFDPEGTWQYDFSKISFYRVLENTVKISEEIIGQRLNGSNFTKKCYEIEETTKADCLKLIKSKAPILFSIELTSPEEIGFFCSWVISEIYDMQRIKRKYHKGKLKQSYFLVLEESENIFDSSSLDKAIFHKFRKKYAEMSNLKIGILSSSQRLTEVNKKFRAKMSGYLFSQISLDDFIGLTERMLKLRLGKDAKKITDKTFRFHFYSTAHNLTVKVPQFKQSGKPYLIQRGFSLPKQEPQAEDQEPVFKPKKKPSRWQRFKNWILFPMGSIDPKYLENNQENEEDLGEEHTLLANDEEEESEMLFW